MNITINLNVDAPPAGADGEPGKDGEPGPTMILVKRKIYAEQEQFDIPSGEGNFGGVFTLRPDTAYVSVRFKTQGTTQANWKQKRIFFQVANDNTNRKEIGLGNMYLRLEGADNATAERIEISMERMLIPVPQGIDGQRWELVVNDKADAGFVLTDLGVRWVLRRIENPSDVPGMEYYEPM